MLRVPLAILGISEGATYQNATALISYWVQTGLGFYLDNLADSLTKFFGLPKPRQQAWFDVDNAILRADFTSRVEGLAKAIQGGLFTPNEARRKEGLAPAAEGDAPRLQQQMVPLEFHAQEAERKEAEAAAEAAAAEAAAAAPPPTDTTEDGQEPPEPDELARMIQESMAA